MKRPLLLLLLLYLSTHVLGQIVRPDAVIDMTTAGFRELSMKPASPVQSVYLTDDWVTGTLVLKPDVKVEGLQMKYDIKNNVLEIYMPDGIKLAPIGKIKSFEYVDKLEQHRYVDADQLHIKGLTGIAEEEVTGGISFYVKPYLRKTPANYNPALDVGNRVDTFEKQETFFLVKNNEAFDITKAGKKILRYFGDRAPAIENFVKQNDLSYKKEKEIVKMIEEFNRN